MKGLACIKRAYLYMYVYVDVGTQESVEISLKVYREEKEKELVLAMKSSLSRHCCCLMNQHPDLILAPRANSFVFFKILPR